MRLSILLATLLGAPVAHAAAQNSPLQPGQRVRVTVPSWHVSKQQTAFQRMAGDTLVLLSASYALADVARLDVHAGRKSHTWLGVGIGSLVGVGVGIGIYQAAGGSSTCPAADPATCTLAVAGIGALGGALLGAVVGGSIKTDKWEEVPLDHWRIGIAPTRHGRVGLGASLSF
jgi:hypothetical protein